ncbi:hypothetical protein Csp2054_10120 [Curtobacterium sp. 'Ferrero']|uniref:hypothetical protein n=1 Tax=Curtobacterium sp. 'Ferrero' TaxID=2033654 RepID=UPI000BDC7C89|nr:hypothetical protein [Curtobacterium sp. 'Ferrero']PCN47721.1 hypothetical protein Csp2054_10120 [Curtobacterium sp. 'Ferrero']
MNPLLFWTAIGTGITLCGVAARSWTHDRSRARPTVDRRLVDLLLAVVGGFLVLIGAALLAGPSTSVLVVLLVVLLGVALLCLAAGRGAAPADPSGADHEQVRGDVTDLLRRADYHQLSLTLLRVGIVDAPDVVRAFGEETLATGLRDVAAAVRRSAPPDATVWMPARDAVVVVVRTDDLDIPALRAEVETAVAEGAFVVATGMRPLLEWARADSDEHGYELADLERAVGATAR